MKVCVFGMFHLGLVTSACLATKSLKVVCLDTDVNVIENLKNDIFPIQEPHVAEFFKDFKSNLSFEHDVSCVKDCDYIWVTFDTPVDDNDVADVDFVINNIRKVLNEKPDAVMVVSSQLPVGTIAKIELEYPQATIACSPENLRLGKSIQNFMNPDRIVVGTRTEQDKEKFMFLFQSISFKITWVKTESAEMVKHTINAFLANCITFSNEIAKVCEILDINVEEVERCFLSEERIGTTLPLRSGMGFAGGTLARDVNFLDNIHPKSLIFSNIYKSNKKHNAWPKKKIKKVANHIQNFGIVGLTYKPNTNTLRRSEALKLCEYLSKKGKNVFALDTNLNTKIKGVTFVNNAEELCKNVECVIIFNNKDQIDNSLLNNKIVIDPNGFKSFELSNSKKCIYYKVGKNNLDLS